MPTLANLASHFSGRLVPLGVSLASLPPEDISQLSPADRLALLEVRERESRHILDGILRAHFETGAWPAALTPWQSWFLHQRNCLAADMMARLEDSLPDGTSAPLSETSQDALDHYRWALIDLWREFCAYWLRILAFDLDPMRLLPPAS